MSVPEEDPTTAIPDDVVDPRTARVLRAVESTALGVAVGASAGFAFIEAPAASRVVRDLDLFADLIGLTLDRLTRLLFVAGSVAAAAASARAQNDSRRPARHVARFAAAEASLGLLFYHRRVTMPRMNDARRAMGASFRDVPEDDPARVLYRKRHKESTRVYGTALLLILGALVASSADEC